MAKTSRGDLSSGGKVFPILLHDVDEMFLDGREIFRWKALDPGLNESFVRRLVLAQRHLPVAPNDGIGLLGPT